MNKIVKMVCRTCVYLIGFSVLLYPTVSKYVNTLHGTSVVNDYQQQISRTTEDQENQMLKDARAYNKRLISSYGTESAGDPFAPGIKKENQEYESLLNLRDDGMMGYIEIPKIKALLPIYHGTSEEVLQSGVGHMEDTSLPVGGESTHAVLSGHRGLTTARLFTDLDQMEEGDVFYIKVLHETLAYQVDQILTVLPSETEALQVTAGADQVTLVTCTPYMINTHRLLVRGERIPYEEAVEVAEELDIKPQMPFTQKLLIGGIGAVALIWILVKLVEIVRWFRDQKKTEEGHDEE